MTDRLIGLLIEFDEMGFAPSTLCMEDAVCWERVIDKEMRGKEAEARLAEMKGE